MNLSKPPTAKQIDAAQALHDRLPGLKATDNALALLAERLPGFDYETCLLKTVAVNSLYGAMVFATSRMAQHIHDSLSENRIAARGPELVESIAALPDSSGKVVTRRFRSFASKFCHFFIDSGRFPIFDSYTDQTITYHLGGNRAKNPTWPYLAFAKNFFAMRSASGLRGRPGRVLDRYLWLAGQYRVFFRKPETRFNSDVRALFESSDPEVQHLLRQLIKP